MLLSVAIFMGACSIATQRFAKWAGYHPTLNYISKPILGKVYNPFAIAMWKKQYYEIAKIEFDKDLQIVQIGLAFSVFVLLVSIFLIKNKKAPLTSHGSARWATEEELEKTGLTKPEGVMLGVTANNKYIRHDGAEHIIVYAPTRSGKGVGIIIPTLLAWKKSVLVIDIKGENWGITSGFRKNILKNKVLKFDPTCVDGSGARFNPLNEIRVGTPSEVKDTQRIVNMIVDTGEKGPDHWSKTASALLLGLILYVLYCEEDKTLSRVADIINNPESEDDVGETLKEMAVRRHADPSLMSVLYGQDEHGPMAGVHPKIWNALLECGNKPDNERGSVISTAVSNLALYRDPIIKHNISGSDFKISDLMNYDSPVSLYIVIPPSDIERVVPLTRIIVNQVITSLTEKMEFKDGLPVVNYKHKLLLLLDEFPALGRIDTFEKALAFIAGYGLKALLIIQSLNQINKIYTKDNSILDNCHIRIAYTPNDNHTADEISKSLGDATILVDSYNFEKGFSLLGPRKSGRSGQSRKLMTPGEVMVMPASDEIVFFAGIPPYKAKKIIYWKDYNFKKRLMPAPDRSDVILQNIVNNNDKNDSEISPIDDAIGSGIITKQIVTETENTLSKDILANEFSNINNNIDQLLANGEKGIVDNILSRMPSDTEIEQSIKYMEFNEPPFFYESIDQIEREADDLTQFITKMDDKNE